jgi:hypothetical protein
MSEADSSNYFQVALVDTTRAESRQQRIEAAVQRSKTEYCQEHAYTERGVGDTCCRLTSECVERKGLGESQSGSPAAR